MMKRYFTQLSVQHNRHTFSNVKSCGDNNNIPQAHNRAVRQASELPEEQNPERIPKESRTTDRDGNIPQYTAYLPYGELLVDEHSSSEEMPYKFNGKEFDEETGLYYYGARYMQPITSVWYGVDPLTEKYPNVSGYVYCMGNPVRLVDVDGMDWYLHDGQYIWQNSTNKTYKDSKGTIWKNVGHTYTDKKTGAYYSLFGQKYGENHKDLQAVKNIDNAVMEQAKYEAGEEYKYEQLFSPSYNYSCETISPPTPNFGGAYEFVDNSTGKIIWDGLKNLFNPEKAKRLVNPNEHRLAYGEYLENTTYRIANVSENNTAPKDVMMEEIKSHSFGLSPRREAEVGIRFCNDNRFEPVEVLFSPAAGQRNKSFYNKLKVSYKNKLKK